MPQVLIVNDDGIDAPGLTTLVKYINKLEHVDVFVVAPDRERSAFSHSITLGAVMSAEVREVPGAKMAFAVGGTPADCTMLALGALFPGTDFDCVVGGINRGDNAGRHIIYSGTVACAREAACHGLVGVSTSLDSTSKDADYEVAAALAADFVGALLESPGHLAALRGRVVNINFPAVPEGGKVNGWRATLPGAWTYRDFWKQVAAPGEAEEGTEGGAATEQAATVAGPNSAPEAGGVEGAKAVAAQQDVATAVPAPGAKGDGTWDAEPGRKYYFTNTSAPPHKDFTEGTDYASFKQGFVSVSVLELVYKSALALGQTGGQHAADAFLAPDIATGACPDARSFLAAMRLREPCVGGSRVGFGIPPWHPPAPAADAAVNAETE